MSERAVTLAPEAIDAVAHRVDELLRDEPTPDRTRLLTAQQLADAIGVDRSWVYEHSHKLGGQRLGDGPRARLRFDRDVALTAWQDREAHAGPEPERATPRRRAHTSSTPLLPIRGQDAG